MVKFNEDEDLGKVIAKKQLFSFGAAPLTEFKEIVFAAGGNKFSSLCGFRFESKAETDYKQFFIAFVCKLRSKIYHTAVSNPSQWFIFKKISGKEMHCLSKEDLKNQYGFDIDKFFDSDYFQQSVLRFKKTIDKGLKSYVPEFVKKHGMEKAKDLLTSYDGQNEDALVKDAIGRYVTAIKESLQYIDDTTCNDKFYKLIDYDIAVEKEVDEADIVAEASRWECEVEEKDGKFEVYEKADHVWAATFASKEAAEAFCKSYPKMKEEYINQATEAETKKQMVENEKPTRKISETDGEWSIYARTLRSYDGYNFYVDVHPNHFYTQKAAEMWKKIFEEEISDSLQYWYGQTMERHELYVCRASDIKNPKLISASAAEHDPKYRKAWAEYEEELKNPKYNEGLGDDSVLKGYDAAMKANRRKIEEIYKSDSNTTESDEIDEKELDDKIEEAMKEIYK